MIMPVLYILQALLVAAALMMAAAAYPRLTGLSFAARSALGLTLTPPVLGLLTLGIAFVWPGAPRAAFLLIPGIMGALVLLSMRARMPAVAAGAQSCYARWRHDPRGRWMILAGCLCLIVFILTAIGSSYGVVIGHDALVYLAEAKVFAEARSIAAVPGFDAGIGQVVKTHPHLFLWQAYLAQGLMASDGALGYGHDYFARAAAQATLALTPVSVMIVTRAATPARTVWLAPIALLVFGLEYIPTNYSIDGFRIITYMALAALIVAAAGHSRRWNVGQGLLIAVVAAIAAAAHTLDIVLVVLTAFVFLAAGFLSFVGWRTIAVAAVAGLILAVPVGLPYLHNWLTYHNVLGQGMNYLIYRDTPLMAVFERQRPWLHTTDIATAFLTFAAQYRLVPMMLAVVGAALALVLSFRRPAIGKLSFLSALLLVLVFVPLLPMDGLQGAVLSNVRYGLVTCALAAAVIAGFLAFVVRYAAPSMRRHSWTIPTCAVAATLLFAWACWSLLFPSARISHAAAHYLEESDLFVARAADALPSGTNWATDRYSATYYAARPPMFLYSNLGHPLLAARDETAVRAFLSEYRVGLVALCTPDSDWWPATEFYRALIRVPGVRVVPGRHCTLYFLPARIAREKR